MGIDTFDNKTFNHDLLHMMIYFQEYLDDNWTIKKKKACYILTKNKQKILVSDSIYLSKSIVDHKNNQNRNKNKNNNEDLFEDDGPCKDVVYLLYFMYNVLNNGWTVKKSGKMDDKYVFIKNHEGKKEYFSNKYIHTFLKENFNFNLIK